MSWPTPLLDEIAGIVGDSATRSLVHVYPGTRLYVPTTPKLNPRHPIAALIGMDLARKLCERFGGELIELPTGGALSVLARNVEIRRLYRNGRTIDDIARQYQLARRHVRRIVIVAREDAHG